MADVATARPSSLAAYRVLVGSRVRSQVSYRTSFAVDVLASLLLAVVELAEVYIIFHNVDVLGGLDLPAALLVFGLAHLGFALANAVAGTLDTMPTYIRTGTLEALMLRPQPVLAQVLTGEVTLKRLGAASVGLVTLAAAVAVQDVDWTPGRVVLLVTTPLCAAVVFASLFLAAGALQFWLVDASEVTHSFTYGSAYASSFSSAVLPQPLRWAFAFVVPAAFTAYLPALVILGLPGPAGLPAWLGWFTPVVAALSAAAALGLWRLGIRHYTGAGG